MTACTLHRIICVVFRLLVLGIINSRRHCRFCMGQVNGTKYMQLMRNRCTHLFLPQSQFLVGHLAVMLITFIYFAFTSNYYYILYFPLPYCAIY